jgi:hypothetical protein
VFDLHLIIKGGIKPPALHRLNQGETQFHLSHSLRCQANFLQDRNIETKTIMAEKRTQLSKKLVCHPERSHTNLLRISFYLFFLCYIFKIQKFAFAFDELRNPFESMHKGFIGLRFFS